MSQPVKVLAADNVTHNVRQFVVERPGGYAFQPGQATTVSLESPKWKDETRPFTFTSLPSDPRLEFTIKIYPEHDGVTDQMGELGEGDRIVLHEVFGAITYQGPGTFLAGGAGVTPFIAILRQLEKEDKLAGNRLIFSNQTARDIILKTEFVRMLGDNVTFTLTRERNERFEHGRIDAEFLRRHGVDLKGRFYVCGPPKMVKELTGTLKGLGAASEGIVIEK
jgi:ferredoxin-NADP reductase